MGLLSSDVTCNNNNLQNHEYRQARRILREDGSRAGLPKSSFLATEE